MSVRQQCELLLYSTQLSPEEVQKKAPHNYFPLDKKSLDSLVLKAYRNSEFIFRIFVEPVRDIAKRRCDYKEQI